MARLLLRMSLAALILALALTVALQVRMPREVVQVLALPDEVLGIAVAQPTTQPATITPTPPLPTATLVPTVASEPTTVVLQQGRDGYLGTTDTFVQFYARDNNYCDSPELFVVTTDKASAFLRFDLTAIPGAASDLAAGATIVTATLEIYAIQGNEGAEIGLYLPLSEWDACSVTWTQPWEQPGANGPADRAQEPLQVIKTGAAPQWLQFDVTDQVTSWLLDPSSNHGLLVKSLDVTVPSQHILYASEHSDLEHRPRLTIRYEPAWNTPEATATPASVEGPAATPSAPAGTPEAHASVAPNPTAEPAPSLTPITTPTAISVGSPRVIEIHWWNPMEVGAGYPVTLVFRPEKQGLSASEMDDYVLAVNAQLGASNLDITTESAQLQVLTDAQYSLVWRWMVQPRSTGERELELDVNLSWTPAVAGLAPVRTEPGTWQQSRTVRVNPSFAYWPLMRTVRVALMGVGLLFWLGWLVLHQRRRKSGSL